MSDRDVIMPVQALMIVLAIVCAIASGLCLSGHAPARALTFGLLSLIFGIWAK